MRNREWHDQQNITLLTETTANAIDTDSCTVTLHDATTLPYTALLVATGGRANPLKTPAIAIQKLGVRNRMEAARLAEQKGWL